MTVYTGQGNTARVYTPQEDMGTFFCIYNILGEKLYTTDGFPVYFGSFRGFVEQESGVKTWLEQ